MASSTPLIDPPPATGVPVKLPDFRQANLQIFKSGAAPIFQPRIDFWISENTRQGTLPLRYQGLSPLQVHADLGCSIRPYKMFNPCLSRAKYATVRIEEQVSDDGQTVCTRWITTLGSLEQIQHRLENASHISQWAVRHSDDYRILAYILEDQLFEWDAAHYAHEDAALGQLGAPQLFLPRVNLMRLMVHWIGMENTMLGLMEEPEKTEELMSIIDRREEDLLRHVAASPVPIINYGDNIDRYLVPPAYLMQYIKPQYERRGEVLRTTGKYVHSHFDGWMCSLLPYLSKLPLDGIEALTPLPQGDVTLDQIREALPDDMVLLDGIPMTLFLPSSPLQELDDFVDRLLELFSPRLIAGISDELSPVCDIERVRRVARRIHRN